MRGLPRRASWTWGPRRSWRRSPGTAEKIDGLVDVLRPFGVLEMVRTGAVAMVRSAEATDDAAESPLGPTTHDDVKAA